MKQGVKELCNIVILGVVGFLKIVRCLPMVKSTRNGSSPKIGDVRGVGGIQ